MRTKNLKNNGNIHNEFMILSEKKDEFTLICIDIQPHFSVEKDILGQCKREVEEAVAHNRHIIFLEYIDCGKTDPELLEAVSNYRNYTIITKDQNDGAPAIIGRLPAIRDRINQMHFRVCGVYTDQCVFSTVKGLRRGFPAAKVDVVSDAVNASYHEFQDVYLNKLKQLPSVALVEAA